MDQKQREWTDAGQPEPVAAERVDDGECAYSDCENDADFRVLWENNRNQSGTTLMCKTCSVTNHVYAEDNDLLDAPIDP